MDILTDVNLPPDCVERFKKLAEDISKKHSVSFDSVFILLARLWIERHTVESYLSADDKYDLGKRRGELKKFRGKTQKLLDAYQDLKTGPLLCIPPFEDAQPHLERSLNSIDRALEKMSSPGPKTDLFSQILSRLATRWWIESIDPDPVIGYDRDIAFTGDLPNFILKIYTALDVEPPDTSTLKTQIYTSLADLKKEKRQ